MIIRIKEQQAGQRWVVTLDAWQVGFKRLDEAQAFARTLQGRIDAPHPWPALRPVAPQVPAARRTPAPAAP